MVIKQISAFVENKSSGVAEITGILGAVGVDIRALSIADTTEFGILRMIVNDTKKAEDALKEAGISVKVTKVSALAVSDAPGGLAGALDLLSKGGINIEYIYAFIGGKDKGALVVFKADNQEKAEEILSGTKFSELSTKDLFENIGGRD